jgi:hypothetical protein
MTRKILRMNCGETALAQGGMEASPPFFASPAMPFFR